MIGWLERLLPGRTRDAAAGAAHDVRLDKAEADLAHLRGRADDALGTLNDRHDRNHWSESIQELITGVLR